jgi:hypothetical protein
MRHLWNDKWQCKPKVLEKGVLLCSSVYNKFHMDDQELNLGLYSRKLAPNYLRYGMAKGGSSVLIQLIFTTHSLVFTMVHISKFHGISKL